VFWALKFEQLGLDTNLNTQAEACACALTTTKRSKWKVTSDWLLLWTSTLTLPDLWWAELSAPVNCALIVVSGIPNPSHDSHVSNVTMVRSHVASIYEITCWSIFTYKYKQMTGWNPSLRWRWSCDGRFRATETMAPPGNGTHNHLAKQTIRINNSPSCLCIHLHAPISPKLLFTVESPLSTMIIYLAFNFHAVLTRVIIVI
jgi:hypothetical protein